MGTAQVGSVAGALKLVANKVLREGGSSGEFTRRSLDTIRGHLTSNKGLGRDVIIEQLAGTPGINENTTKQALSTIKASGDDARIIREVQEDIERENAAAGPLPSVSDPSPAVSWGL